jgi:hypothetical protein
MGDYSPNLQEGTEVRVTKIDKKNNNLSYILSGKREQVVQSVTDISFPPPALK